MSGFTRTTFFARLSYEMPPRVKGGKKGRVAALPPGSELEILAWGHHMEQTAKWRGVAAEIQAFTNDASLGLLSGTGRAEWALYADYETVITINT